MNGSAHRVLTTLLIFPAGWFALRIEPGRLDIASGIALGCSLGTVITPDLDISRKLGFWSLYAALFSHRGISHWPVIGTVTRVAYMIWPFVLLVRYFNLPWEFAKEFLIAAFIGLCVADFGHWFLDLFPTGDKQYD